MLKSESYLFEILQKYSKFGEWKFFEILDNSGKSLPQAKNYGNGFISYPDFEFYSDKKLMLLVEVKGYDGFFDNQDSMVAMKLRCYKSYLKVRKQEDVDVRICFVINFPKETVIFWDSIDNIVQYPKFVQRRNYDEYDFNKRMKISKSEDYIYWNIENFRTDEENIANI